jgi:hypothetical protein
MSIFCDRFACVGVQGYSHATSKGVAQYELEKGRARRRWESEGNEMVGEKGEVPHMARAAEEDVFSSE